MKQTLIFLASFLAAIPGWADLFPYPNIELSSANSLTPGNNSDGIGNLTALYDDATNRLCMTMSWTLDTTSTLTTVAHYHGPASTTQTAGVQIGLTGLSTAVSASHREISSLSEPQEADLLSGLWYLNIHSDQFSAGELRGQMLDAPFTHVFANLPLDTTQEGIAPTGGSGTINATYDDVTNLLTFCVEWSGLTGALNGAHFHEAPPGTPGPITIGINTLPGFPLAANGFFAAAVTVNEADEPDLLSGMWYINLHTAAHSGGEIRGQLTLPVVEEPTPTPTLDPTPTPSPTPDQVSSSVENWEKFE